MGLQHPRSDRPTASRGWRPRQWAAVILSIHAALLAWLAARHSPTIHEMAHLPAGICHWQYGMFELYRVNPPLSRMVAALPVLLFEPKTDWGNYQLGPLARETIPMGIRFAKANGRRTIFLFTVARWASIPFCLLGGWVCYRWASDLWGGASGLMALCLWCFNPMILGHGAVVMPDVPAAAMGTLAAWCFWKWLREPSWTAALFAGVALGLADLCKTTLLVFFILWPVVWLAYSSHHAPRDVSSGRRPRGVLRWSVIVASALITRSVMATMRRTGLQLIAILLLAVYLINLGYAFKGSFQHLGDYRFQSRALSGQPRAEPPKTGNRFAGTWLARLPVPLPRDYVQGIDCQRSDFEIGGRSYLHGQWSPRGWWYYYLIGLGIKTPLGTLAALLLVAIISVGIALGGNPRAGEDGPPGPSSNGGRAGENLQLPPGEGRGEGGRRHAAADQSLRATRRHELFLLAATLAILALTSSQTGFSTHVRYAIPALPYLFIWCGKLVAEQMGLSRERPAWCSATNHWMPDRRAAERHRGRSLQIIFACLCIAATIVESLAVYPHSLSFFNLIIGGPRRGHEWLLGSNGAWGQDLLYLKDWLDRHPDARPLRLATVGWLDPQALGIEYTLPPVGPSRAVSDEDRSRVASGSRQRAGNTALSALGRPGRAKRDDSSVAQTWEDVRLLDDLGPQPGWYVIEVNFLHGAEWPANRPGWRFQKIAEELNYEYFRLVEPTDRVAYSYLVYHITPEAADRVRRSLGLTPAK